MSKEDKLDKVDTEVSKKEDKYVTFRHRTSNGFCKSYTFSRTIFLEDGTPVRKAGLEAQFKDSVCRLDKKEDAKLIKLLRASIKSRKLMGVSEVDDAVNADGKKLGSMVGKLYEMNEVSLRALFSKSELDKYELYTASKNELIGKFMQLGRVF